VPVHDQSNKSIIGKIYGKTVSTVLLFIRSGVEAVPAVAHIHIVICKQEGINPEYENILS
jgi:hypothetical protein